MYESITCYLGRLKPAKYINPKQIGKSLLFQDILNMTRQQENADVSNLDGYTILFMIFSTIRGERFCNGLVSGYIENGSMDKWLSRLKEIDEK